MSINYLWHYSTSPCDSLKPKALQNQGIPPEQVEWMRKTNDVAPLDQHVRFFMAPVPLDFISTKFENHPFGGANVHKTVFEHKVKLYDMMIHGIIGWKIAESPLEIEFRMTWPWTDKSDEEVGTYIRHLHDMLRKNGMMGSSGLALATALKKFADYDLLDAYAATQNATLYAEGVMHVMIYTDKPIPVAVITTA